MLTVVLSARSNAKFEHTEHAKTGAAAHHGEAGVLERRGYSIADLTAHSSSLEVAYLLIDGALPTQDQYDEWEHEITLHAYVHENIARFMEGFRDDAQPVGMLLSTVGA